MECSEREVAVSEEQPLEPLIIIEEGDITENTVTGLETTSEKSCDDEDEEETGQIGTLNSKSEEDGNPGRYPGQVKQNYNLDKTNQYLVTNEEGTTPPGSAKVEEPGGSKTEESENNQEIIKQEIDGDTTDHKSQEGIEMEELKAQNTKENDKLYIETPTEALQVDTNKVSPSDQPLSEMSSTVHSQKQARRLTPDFPDTLYELLCTLQEGRRLNDQRCSFTMETGGRRRRCHSEPSITMPPKRVIFSSMTSLQKEEFFEFVATSQARRLNDQRAELLKSPPPKSKANRLRGSIKLSIMRKSPAITVPKEDLYNMILTSQAQGRLEEQRSDAPGPMDDEDFFSLLLKVQGERMEEQRTVLPTAMFSLIALLITNLPTEGDTSPITCYNDEGVAVDWFYMYKLPHEHGGQTQEDGQKYLIMNKGSEGWMDGKVLVNDSTGALGRTVGQLYQQEKSSELAYILYNDQSPPGDMSDRWFNESGSRSGHTKGVVLLDKNQGFWLVHSTPRFPPVQKEGQYSFPSNGVINGQNFICVTYPLERFQAIGEQLLINQPHVYDCDVPASLASLVHSIATVCKKNQMANIIFPSTRPQANRSMSLTSLGGTKFLSFAKGASFNNDLYHSWVAPTLQSDLLVQFWVRSPGILPSDCTRGWKVLDITSLSPGQRFTYKASQDHSKWAVSTKGNWICVGDINRNKAEEMRGGGTVCQQDARVWKAYWMAALQCQMCGGTSGECATSVG